MAFVLTFDSVLGFELGSYLITNARDLTSRKKEA